jgi:hypothetical protein
VLPRRHLGEARCPVAKFKGVLLLLELTLLKDLRRGLDVA